uniref:Zinc finger, HIT-type containing 3 n=1 Tax=Gasterosteus aculeatus aculeatus TaxID=481459 RepID=A0AAQ4QLJ1_GASAC
MLLYYYTIYYSYYVTSCDNIWRTYCVGHRPLINHWNLCLSIDTCLPVERPAPIDPEATDSFNTETWTVEDLLHEEDIIDKVPLQRLKLLGQSKELRDVLCNPHLRELLRSIDGADSKADAMKAAMQEPLFVEFSDRCLKIVENEAKSCNEDEVF